MVRIDRSQAAVVGVLAGNGRLVVVEGAAGAGKTTAFRATQELLRMQGHRLMVVTPTLKAAEVAVEAFGVVPVHPAEGRELEILDSSPGSWAGPRTSSVS